MSIGVHFPYPDTSNTCGVSFCNRIKEPHKTHPYFSFHLSISHARRVYNEQLTAGWTRIESGNCDGLEYMDLYR